MLRIRSVASNLLCAAVAALLPGLAVAETVVDEDFEGGFAGTLLGDAQIVEIDGEGRVLRLVDAPGETGFAWIDHAVPLDAAVTVSFDLRVRATDLSTLTHGVSLIFHVGANDLQSSGIGGRGLGTCRFPFESFSVAIDLTDDGANDPESACDGRVDRTCHVEVNQDLCPGAEPSVATSVHVPDFQEVGRKEIPVRVAVRYDDGVLRVLLQTAGDPAFSAAPVQVLEVPLPELPSAPVAYIGFAGAAHADHNSELEIDDVEIDVVADTPPACFDDKDVSPWTAGDLNTVDGASRAPALPATALELCSRGGWLGTDKDGFRYAFDATIGEFQLTARLDSIDDIGAAGLMARADFRGYDSAYVSIVGRKVREGGVELFSYHRALGGTADTQWNATGVVAAFPVWLRIDRAEHIYTTSYSADGVSFTEQLSLDALGTDLENPANAGLVAASETERESAVAAFSSVELDHPEFLPPVVDCIDSLTIPVEGETEVTISGLFLRDVTGVELAGVAARIVRADSTSVTVLTAPLPDRGGTRTPVRGDVVVRTRGGEVRVANAVAYAGRKFVRGDSNDDGGVGLPDAIHLLRYLFTRGPAPVCPEIAEVNGDLSVDVADVVYLLLHLFAGGPPPAAPYPEPGLGDRPAPVCEPPPAGTFLRLLSASGEPLPAGEELAEGDIVVIEGKELPLLGPNASLHFGNVEATILRVSETEMVVQIGVVPTAGRKCPFIFDAAPIPDARWRSATTRSIRFGDALGVVPSGGELPDICPSFRASAVRHVASSRYEPERARLVLQYDRERWDPRDVHRIHACVFLPVATAVSRGPRIVDFDYFAAFGTDGDGIVFEEWLAGLASRLAVELNGGTARDCDCDLNVAVLPSGDGVEVTPCDDALPLTTPTIPPGPDPPFEPEFPLKALPGPLSTADDFVLNNVRCGDIDDPDPGAVPRLFMWCLFRELTQAGGGGLPVWEHFSPPTISYHAGSALGTISLDSTPPGERTPEDKAILYGPAARGHIDAFGYDHGLTGIVRFHQCDGAHAIFMPGFPPGSLAIKTAWRRESRLPAGVDPDDYYSYHPPGLPRQYLVGFHILHFRSGTTNGTRDWATFWVPRPPGVSTDKMGRPLQYNFICTFGGEGDRPDDLSGVWANFVMCTEAEPGGELCGNPWIPGECSTLSCDGCHTSTSVLFFDEPGGVGQNDHWWQWLPSLTPKPRSVWEDLFEQYRADDGSTPWDGALVQPCENF